jgi:hypothetical protein
VSQGSEQHTVSGSCPTVAQVMNPTAYSSQPWLTAMHECIIILQTYGSLTSTPGTRPFAAFVLPMNLYNVAPTCTTALCSGPA